MKKKLASKIQAKDNLKDIKQKLAQKLKPSK